MCAQSLHLSGEQDDPQDVKHGPKSAPSFCFSATVRDLWQICAQVSILLLPRSPGSTLTALLPYWRMLYTFTLACSRFWCCGSNPEPRTSTAGAVPLSSIQTWFYFVLLFILLVCHLVWSETHNSPASASQVLRLQPCTTVLTTSTAKLEFQFSCLGCKRHRKGAGRESLCPVFQGWTCSEWQGND